jgi:hypothetical protein
VGVSSFISALIFVRVSGNVVESASIREFSTDKSFYQTPDVHFAVNMQNTGDTHIRPVGMIQIYNAFGKQRGEIPINETGGLGYVLPSSSREFDVEWQGQPSLWDIGPYTAVLSLGYGENGTKSAAKTVGFWVLPIGQLFEIGFSILLAAAAVMYLLRRAIRKILAREIAKYGGVEELPAPPVATHPAAQIRSTAAPEREEKKPEISSGGVLDLRDKRDE